MKSSILAFTRWLTPQPCHADILPSIDTAVQNGTPIAAWSSLGKSSPFTPGERSVGKLSWDGAIGSVPCSLVSVGPFGIGGFAARKQWRKTNAVQED